MKNDNQPALKSAGNFLYFVLKGFDMGSPIRPSPSSAKQYDKHQPNAYRMPQARAVWVDFTDPDLTDIERYDVDFNDIIGRTAVRFNGQVMFVDLTKPVSAVWDGTGTVLKHVYHGTSKTIDDCDIMNVPVPVPRPEMCEGIY